VIHVLSAVSAWAMSSVIVSKSNTYMKELLRGFTVLLLLFILLVSCEPVAQEGTSTGGSASSQANLSRTTVHDTISVDTFEAWRENWGLYGSSWLDTAELEAFLMPLDDLAQTLNEPDVAESRFYLGLAQTDTGQIAKLMVVGVDARGRDMIDYAQGEYVYDVSKTCPPYCNNPQ